MTTQLIDAYAAGASTLRRAIEGLSDSDLNAFPVPNTWSIRQIVVHTMDSDLVASHRMKRIVAENRPLLIAYDETAFSQRCFYERMDLGLVTDLFEKNRLHTAEFLRCLPAEAFAREGVHNQRGLVTLEAILRGYIHHLDHHMKFLREKRQLLGKPLGW
jgi:hypothetical protein